MKVWVIHTPRWLGAEHRVFATLESAKAAFPEREWYEETLNKTGSWMGVSPRLRQVLIEPRELEGDDHFVTIGHDGWWEMEHSPLCPWGDVECPEWRAIERIADSFDKDDYGRWRIDEIDSEGMPGLVRRIEGHANG